MISSKEELKKFLYRDKIALGITRNRPRLCFDRDIIWKFEILLRKCEYYKNTPSVFHKLLYHYYYYRYHKLSIKLGFSIPLNVFDEGLSIAHYGTIVVNSNCRIGKNCRIQEGVNLGSTNGSDLAPKLGDNVFIGTGAKLIGDINIGNNVCIGANAVVTKSFPDNITIGGVPAKKISDNSSHRILQQLLVNSEEFKNEFLNKSQLETKTNNK